MPVLRVMKNGEHLCTVGSDEVWMFSASVWGDVWGPEVSHLDVSGGSKRNPSGESDFLIWEMPHDLTKLDRLTFFFEEGSASSPMGSKFDPEAYPPEEQKIEISFPPTDDDLTKLESRAPLNIEFSWLISINGVQDIKLSPDVTRQHTSLRMHWDEERPQHLRISISKKSLREISSRNGGENIFLGRVPLGSTVDITVGCPGIQEGRAKARPLI